MNAQMKEGRNDSLNKGPGGPRPRKVLESPVRVHLGDSPGSVPSSCIRWLHPREPPRAQAKGASPHLCTLDMLSLRCSPQEQPVLSRFLSKEVSTTEPGSRVALSMRPKCQPKLPGSLQSPLALAGLPSPIPHSDPSPAFSQSPPSDAAPVPLPPLCVPLMHCACSLGSCCPSLPRIASPSLSAASSSPTATLALSSKSPRRLRLSSLQQVHLPPLLRQVKGLPERIGQSAP